MRDFRELKVWEKAHRLSLEVYRRSNSFPAEERFGLTAQLRRSAVSIGSNIAEGCGREGERELSQFLRIAAGSVSELEYQLLLARDLDYLTDAHHRELERQAREVRRMLHGFLLKLTADG